MKVKALVFPEPNRIEVRELDLPNLGSNEILVRNFHSGVSIGTERWILTNKIHGLKYPVFPGYQSVGKVERIGKKVKTFQVGDVVFISISRVPKGFYEDFGWSTACHMSYLIAREKTKLLQWQPIKISGAFDLKEVSLLTMATVGLNGVYWMNSVKKDDLVLVIGQGLIGQMAAQGARLRGAGKVIAADYVDRRVELSTKYSAHVAINPRSADLLDLVKKVRKKGMDVVIESTGIAQNINDSTRFVRYGGRMVLLGTYHGVSEIELSNIHRKRLTLYTPNYYTRAEQMRALRLVKKKKLRIAQLITHEIKVDDAPCIYNKILHDPSGLLAVVINWEQT